MPRRVLYLDPFSGLSGNMCVGALLDLGFELPRLEAELAKLKLAGYRLAAQKVLRRGITATHFEVLLADAPAHSHGVAEEHAHEHAPAAHGGHAHSHAPHAGHAHAPAHEHAHGHRSFAEIRALIESSTLAARVQERSLRAFTLLAEAEGKIHGRPPEEVRFHEVGAVDSIVDFVGTCVGLEALGIDEVLCGPVALGEAAAGALPAAHASKAHAPAGRGSKTHPPAAQAPADWKAGGYVSCAHGWLPIPAFATLELLRGVPLRPCPVNAELTTPTGAALVRALCSAFGPLPPGLRIEALGYGAGTRDDPAIALPNVLRVALGTLAEPSAEAHAAAGATSGTCDTVCEIQANLDDTTPEVLGYVTERLLALGALDVFCAPVQMKKGRPGTVLTVLAPAGGGVFDALVEALFRETPTFGMRYAVKQRMKLEREARRVGTPWGPVGVKVGRWRGHVVSVHPEYEDCRALAERHGVPLRAVIEAARGAAGR